VADVCLAQQEARDAVRRVSVIRPTADDLADAAVAAVLVHARVLVEHAPEADYDGDLWCRHADHDLRGPDWPCPDYTRASEAVSR